MKKLAIFDLDGTLVNTIADLGEAVNYALRQKGFQEHPIKAYNMMVGNGVRKLIERATPDIDPALSAELLASFREYYDDHCTDNSKPYEGIPELLATLREQGVEMAVASNKYQYATDKIIKHCFPDVEFIKVNGQVEGRPIKPDPSIVFDILGDAGIPKREVIYIGDSAVDIETARRACVCSVGVTWGFRPVSELRKACPNHIVSQPSEILKYLGDEF